MNEIEDYLLNRKIIRGEVFHDYSEINAINPIHFIKIYNVIEKYFDGAKLAKHENFNDKYFYDLIHDKNLCIEFQYHFKIIETITEPKAEYDLRKRKEELDKKRREDEIMTDKFISLEFQARQIGYTLTKI